jgi:hypothetical protein
MKSFRDWLLDYKRNTRIRDLADDARRDPPMETNWGTHELLLHMMGRRACIDAFNALGAAKQAYARYVAKTTLPL